MTTIIHRLMLGTVGLAALGVIAAAAPPATMKAVRIHEFGGSDVLKVEDMPVPTPGPNEVLVHVRAAGVNPVDWKLRDGMNKAMKLPFTLGFDVAGVVESVGANVKDVKEGDDVFAYLSIKRGGGYAEYAIVGVNELAKKPKNVDHAHAAAVPLAALTAWQAMFDTAKLSAGQTILIHGAAGGVGHFAVQLAKTKGAKVIATASAANADFVKSLGADQVIDYKAQKFDDVVKDVDVVFDMIGGDTLERSYKVVKEGGFIVSIVAMPDSKKLEARKAKGTVFLVHPDAKQLSELGAMMEAGTLKPTVSATFELKDAAKAHEKSKTGVDRGKIVLTVP